MQVCEYCYNHMEVSYSVSGNGVINGKDYVAQKYFDSLEEAENFYELVSPVNKVIIWELREVFSCNKCTKVRDRILKSTKKKPEVRPKYQEKKYPN